MTICVTTVYTSDMRKERVLHARIPEDLERELKKRSASLGLSVSTVVRNVLMHTFDLVEGIVIDRSYLEVNRLSPADADGDEPRSGGRRSARRVSRPEAAAASVPRFDATVGIGDARPRVESTSVSTPASVSASGPTLGWQQLTLNVNAVCELCNSLLARGTVAAVAIPISPRPEFSCVECVEALSTADSEAAPTSSGRSRAKPGSNKKVARKSVRKPAASKRRTKKGG